MRAPPPAPPPIMPAERLPLPFSSCSYSEVWTGMPPMLVSWMPRLPEPLKRPRPLAAMTVPATGVPRGKTTVPWCTRDWARAPVKGSPTSLCLALRLSVMLTLTLVPAGMVGGGGGGVEVVAEGRLPLVRWSGSGAGGLAGALCASGAAAVLADCG